MEHNIKEIKVKNSPEYDKGFKVWQIHAEFSYRSAWFRLSDNLSGCGPVHMYRYTDASDFTNDITVEDFIFLFKSVIENAIKFPSRPDGWFIRTPTSVLFVQGIYRGSGYINFKEIMLSLGFECREYQNIAHGLNTTDKQAFFYLDIKDKYITK